MKRITRDSLLSAVLSGVAILAIPAAVSAQTFTWTGSCSTAWHDGCNWDLNMVPPDGNSSVVVNLPPLDSPVQTLIGLPTAFAGTLVNMGELINSSHLQNSGSMTSTDGIIRNSGTFVNSGLIEFIPGGFLSNSGDFDNYGTVFAATPSGGVQNTGTLNNYNILTSNGGINNSGTLNNYGQISSGDCCVVNTGTMNNFGSFSLSSDSGFLNQGILNNSGFIGNFSSHSSIDPTGQLINTGVIDNQSGALSVAGLLQNSGSILGGGCCDGIRVTQSGQIQNTGNISAVVLTVAGLLNNDGTVTMASTDPLQILTTGTLSGTGVINGNVDMQGVLGPGNSTGILTINGNYFQGSTGQLQIEIGGATPGTGYDQLQLNGTAFLDGLLLLAFVNQFSPQDGDTILFLVYNGFSGAFSSVTVSNLSSLFTWTINYGANGASVTFHRVIPEPSTLLLFSTGLAAALYRRRRSRRSRPSEA